MKHMKNALSLLLVCAFCLTILAGCAKKKQTPAGTISEFESQAHIQPGASGDDHASGDTSKAPVSGDFVVSEKKYDYKDANIMVLYVENQTNRHYNVTIKGKYLDENGETIKEEAQTFEGFSAGWANHFIFYPRTAFDSFTYELETEEWAVDPLTGDENGPYTGYIKFTYSKKLAWKRGVLGGDENGHSIEGRDLWLDHELVSTHPTAPLHGAVRFLILDTDGEIWATSYEDLEKDGIYTGMKGIACNPPGMEKSYKSIMIKQQAVGEDETIPDNVQGVFTAIVAINFIVHEGLYDKMPTEEKFAKYGTAV